MTLNKTSLNVTRKKKKNHARKHWKGECREVREGYGDFRYAKEQCWWRDLKVDGTMTHRKGNKKVDGGVC